MTDADRLIAEINDYYNRRALWHDYYMGYTTLEKMERLLQPIIEYIGKYIVDKNILEIGCGTGNWTQVLAKKAKSVHATDSSPAAIKIAQKKLSEFKNISFQVSDAYTLSNVERQFNCLFASDWWSHIPKSKIEVFLKTITAKLIPEAYVLFLDMSWKDYFKNEPYYYDIEGNRISIRDLPDGSEFRVVKNFPTENEIRDFVHNYGTDIIYKEFDSLKRWLVLYRAKDMAFLNV